MKDFEVFINSEGGKFVERFTNGELDRFIKNLTELSVIRKEMFRKPNLCPQCKIREVKVIYHRWDGDDVACDCGFSAYWD